MKIWLPYVYAGTGSDVFTHTLGDALRKQGVEVVVTRFAHAWQYFPWRLRLARMPQGTDIVLANSWNAFVFARPNVPLVAVEHLFVLDPALAPYRSFAQGVFHNLFVRYYVWRSYRRADAVVALSDYARRIMTRIFPFCSPLVINNGIDTGFFTPASDTADSDKDKIRLLFIGNPSQRKGADLLPAIMRRLGPGYELAYTSGLKDADPFREVEGMVSLGKLDREGAREAYREADLLLFPSRLEGLPLVVMESLACGTPAIVVDATSLPEMVESGVTGHVAALDDVEGLADAIRRIASDRALLNDMRQAARKRAEERYSTEHMTARYMELFERLSSAGPQSR